MAYLIDTSILGRLANSSDAQSTVATCAVLELHRRGEALHVAPQVMIEFRNVATRPVEVNGLVLSIEEAEALAATFEARFPLLPDTAGIYPAWKKLVHGLSVIGKQVHDARHVAVCHVHEISHVLTFNVSHFERFASFAPGIVVVDPASVQGIAEPNPAADGGRDPGS
jgi:predicted nucleic acid-binding protein